VDRKYWLGGKAAQSEPFMVPRKGPANDGERDVLERPRIVPPRPGSTTPRGH
jgi:hypothetical protein